MTIIKIAALCVFAALACAALKAARPEIAMVTALAAGVCACLLAFDDVRAVVAVLRSLAARAGVADENTSVLVKSAGVALIGEYAAAVCRDAGESGLAQRVEFGARCALVGLAVPMAARIVEQLQALMI